MDIDVQVHPVAALFPMLADDELRELAEDIRQRGLLQPIVLAPDGSILDGRNRYAACQLAGVEPQYVTYEGDDPDGYAWSINVKRRNLTKAQIAIVAADRFDGKNLPSREIAERAGVSHPMVVWALAVRRYPDLHSTVLAGGSLKDAYDEAQERDRAEAERQAKVERLRASAADLAALVDEQRVSVDDAIAALNAREAEAFAERQRQEAEETRRKQVATELMGFVEKVARLAGGDTAERYDPEVATQMQQRRITRQLLADARTALDEIEETLMRRGLL